MVAQDAFEKFASTILNAYHRDKENFWAAIMAPFLASDTSLFDWWRQLKVDVNLLSAFKGLDEDAQAILREFSSPLGFDVSQWKSNRKQYFKDAYPVFAFLAVWLDEMGQNELVEKFGEILKACAFAVSGYGILDENVDRDNPAPVEILTAYALIAEYEFRILSLFGVSQINLEILNKMRSLFLTAEIKEKSLRGKASPYRIDRPQELGAKGANSVGPFMLSLERLGKASLIDDYWQVFLLFGGAIQMIDDWQDLESDLAVGHFSYITLGYEALIDMKNPTKTAKLFREDKNHVLETYNRSEEMIGQARSILLSLNDPFLMRLVDITELRLNNYFRKDLKIILPK